MYQKFRTDPLQNLNMNRLGSIVCLFIVLLLVLTFSIQQHIL